ncbi:MAG TPA: bacteriohemerythrin [Noviherbaspirillum sp.]|nr:bacteriohemerythrin [Noviherbaspirillum sp.]
MTFTSWSDNYAIGIKAIDDQHRWLFDATDKLHHELQKPQVDRAVVQEFLQGLMDYTMNHFIVEEELFERYKYPEAKEHKALHDKFNAAVMDHLMKFEDGADLGNEVLELVRNWLVHHVQNADKKYAPFFAQHGITVP